MRHMIKLLGPWVINNGYPERYYAVVYRMDDCWVVGETGWEAPFAPTEVNVYIYNPFTREFVQQTPQGTQFNFRDFDEYLLYCEVHEFTEDWPSPSWAVACELIDE